MLFEFFNSQFRHNETVVQEYSLYFIKLIFEKLKLNMHRNRYNSVQLDGLNATLLKHQKMTQLPAGPEDPQGDEAKTPMWPSERIGPGGSGAFHTPKVEYSKETADLLKRKYSLIIAGHLI